MIIGGLQKFSLIDYPGKTCAIIFTRGCNFRCRYCHNPELVIPEKYAPEIPLSQIYDFLESRRGKLDAVSITGGEPTQHSNLIEVMKIIKNLGFLVKLDSNGSRPEVFEKIIDEKLADYLAMDIKAPLEDYSKIMGWPMPVEKLKKSIELIMNSGIDYEFRTTIVKSLTSKDDLRKIVKTIQGAKKYFLQKFIPTKLNDPSLMEEALYSDEELKKLALELVAYIKHSDVR
ncbi:MAG: anaerobic ribonucleoside-triphosphate reductase activating protein [Chloroflexi bacterium HGW-Chloroflexi-3]|nr:MAG: anaerobic ribonucleoside-triphosphate reductase activating protein [Chloroflexi bacterium HGW-Chloroflexi-3]